MEYSSLSKKHHGTTQQIVFILFSYIQGLIYLKGTFQHRDLLQVSSGGSENSFSNGDQVGIIFLSGTGSAVRIPKLQIKRLTRGFNPKENRTRITSAESLGKVFCSLLTLNIIK